MFPDAVSYAVRASLQSRVTPDWLYVGTRGSGNVDHANISDKLFASLKKNGMCDRSELNREGSSTNLDIANFPQRSLKRF